MAFRAPGQGHVQGQISKLYQNYISRVQLYPFMVSICILRSRFGILYYSSINIPSIFKLKRGVIVGYHGYIQANLKRTSGSKTTAIVKSGDLDCPNFLNE